MGLIDESCSLTAIGESVLSGCANTEHATSAPLEDKFDEIWALFPKDDGFRHFGKTRMIRWNKSESKKAYLEALKTYTHQDLLKALRNEIAFRNDSSKENLFKYMKGSVNWFKHQSFVDFLEDSEEVRDEHGKGLS